MSQPRQPIDIMPLAAARWQYFPHTLTLRAACMALLTTTRGEHLLTFLDKKFHQKTFAMEWDVSMKLPVGKCMLCPFNFIQLSTILYIGHIAGSMTSWLTWPVCGVRPWSLRGRGAVWGAPCDEPANWYTDLLLWIIAFNNKVQQLYI